MQRVNKLMISVIFSLLIISALSINAQVPNSIMYQGRLVDTTGAVLPSSATFSIYSDSIGGIPLWTNLIDINPDSNGIFTVELGPIADSVFDGNKRYLGIRIGSNNEMVPRQLLTSVPYSYKSILTDNSVTTSHIADSAVTGSKIESSTISLDHLYQSGATLNQVIKWGSASIILL